MRDRLQRVEERLQPDDCETAFDNWIDGLPEDEHNAAVFYDAWKAAWLTARQQLPVVDEKLHNMMLADLDGVYRFSARKDCDALVTQLIHLSTTSDAKNNPGHHTCLNQQASPADAQDEGLPNASFDTEQEGEGVIAEIDSLDMEGPGMRVTFVVPDGTSWTAGKYRIAAIKNMAGGGA